MIPAIFPGDALIVRHEPMAEAHCGDVVLWARDGKFCAHRVVGIGASETSEKADALITRGDALEANDPAIHRDEFLGRIHAIERRGKRIEIVGRQSSALRALAYIARRSDFAARWLVRCNSLMCWLTRNQHIFTADPWRESVESE